MNTTKPPFNDLKVRQAVNYAVDTEALERIYAGQITGTQQILPPGMPGYKKFELYPHNMAKAKELIAEANPSDRTSRSGPTTKAANNEAGDYYQDVLKKLGFNAKLKVINADNYFTVIGNQSTPDLDTGWSRLVRGLPAPERLLPAAARRRKHPADQQRQLRADRRPDARTRRSPSSAKNSSAPSRKANTPRSTRTTWNRRRGRRTATRTVSTFVSSAIDLEKVIFNPTFEHDLTSFEFK